MSKKSILKIILIVLVIFILLIALLWFFYNREESPTVNNVAETDSRDHGSLNRNSNINNRANQQNREVNVAAEFTSIAKITTERFGSYSSDTYNFANLRDMKYLMTDKMKQWTDDLIDNLSAGDSVSLEYYGITTKALSAKVIIHNKKQDAEVVVSCQKIETKGRDNPNSKTKYQDARIKMLYVNEKWLVDELRWE
ncbi:hypothetical protein KAS41_03205 [Candidatus Parcubacteria bacterium]|nr:hypothetical protein [Candidatus Parcubacteria bacterium]